MRDYLTPGELNAIFRKSLGMAKVVKMSLMAAFVSIFIYWLLLNNVDGVEMLCHISAPLTDSREMASSDGHSSLLQKLNISSAPAFCVTTICEEADA